MSVWRYTAVPLDLGASARTASRGEVTGESPAQVRASLRRVGLQVLDLRPVRMRALPGRSLLGAWGHAYLRRRRRPQLAEVWDGIATMLDSGAPLLSALETVMRGQRRGRAKTMLLEVHDALRGGSSLGQAMRAHPTWFDSAEVAMVEAGEHGGNLPQVLRGLAERHERAGELGQRIVGALAYPAIVAAVGVAALVFLSTVTLPELLGILSDAEVEAPALTENVVAVGQVIAGHGWWIGLTLLASAAGVAALRRVLIRRGCEPPSWLRRLSPEVGRKIALAGTASRLAELIRHGVPMVEAVRVVAPTVRSPALRGRLEMAAERIEHGAELSAALDDEHWFDPEFRRLLDIGQASGELDQLLERLAGRYERASRRLIDRLATLLEPAVILTLAVAIGLVVMAAVLPMIRLREILG